MGADLITLDDYKARHNITSVKDDDKLDSLITSVSQLVKTYCGNSFIDYYGTGNDKIEEFTITWPTSTIQLTESPLISVSTVEERTAYNYGYSTLDTASYEYYVDYETDTIYRTNENGFKYWAEGPGAVRVTYEAGYEEVPEDLKLAIHDLITYYYKEEYKERKTIGTISVANQTTSTQWRNVGFPDHIKRVLDLYKQVQI